MTKGRIEAFSDGVIAIYAAAIPLAYVRPWIAAGLYVTVALIWLIPDSRIERVHQAHAS